MRGELVDIFKCRQQIKEGNCVATEIVTSACGYRVIVSTFLVVYAAQHSFPLMAASFSAILGYFS